MLDPLLVDLENITQYGSVDKPMHSLAYKLLLVPQYPVCNHLHIVALIFVHRCIVRQLLIHPHERGLKQTKVPLTGPAFGPGLIGC